MHPCCDLVDERDDEREVGYLVALVLDDRRENAGNPVELRVVEPSIGGYEVGLIGAFGAACFDATRFTHLS